MNAGIKTFTITSQSFYDRYNQSYQNILTVNAEPCGPIRKIVKRIQFPKLSPFQVDECSPRCGLALKSLRTEYNYNQYYKRNVGCRGNNCDLMTPDEIPDLMTFLLGNGYQIETQITNMLNQSAVKLNNKNMAFTVTYYGATQPNIMYMR